jgi:DNA-directed RNA polymerase subunit RPC12/RpoP
MADMVLTCTVCHSFLDEEDLFCANCGSEAPRHSAGSATAGDTSRLATCNFQCSGCGASMSYDASAGTLRCPFCASQKLVPQPDAKILAPKQVVPFRLRREDAMSAMQAWLKRGFFRPGDLAQRAAVVRMQPVYVPYWVFQAQTFTCWTADSSQTPPGARSDWYPLSGEHQGQYQNLLLGASGALTPHETAAISPFDLTAGVPPGQVDLDNITVEQFTVPRKYARPLATSSLEALEADACVRAYVPGSARNVHVNVRIESMASDPVLLPVWIMSYRYADRVFRFLVNGQNGRCSGDAPFSWWKLLWIGGVVLFVALLALLLSGAIR